MEYVETLTYLHCINQPNNLIWFNFSKIKWTTASSLHGNLLTSEGESRREDQKHAAAVHGESDGKVDRNTCPHK